MNRLFFAAAIRRTSELCRVHSENAPAEKYVQAFSERKNQWLFHNQADSIADMLDKRCLYVRSGIAAGREFIAVSENNR